MEERRRSERMVAFIMAGGMGKRLWPLTADRCKPAVPFGGRYRIVDFVLSNLINSGIHSIYLLVQYKAQSLIEHVRKAWTISPLLPEQFVTIVPPNIENGRERFRGTADAVYQNLNLLTVHQADLVAVFGADHIYRMDVRQMVRFHREREADITVAALPVPIEGASSFGVIEAERDGRILGFQEKPQRPRPMPTDPGRAYASMGNYLFKAEVLIKALREATERGETDFGHHVLPRLAERCRLYAYDFADNRIPGVKPYEEPHYWRDVGSLDTYFETHKDVLSAQPRFDAFNPQWPIFSSHYQGPVARIYDSRLDNSLVAGAVVIDRARVRDSIIRRETVIERGAELEECIIMDYVRVCRGARLRRVIVDRHNCIPPEARIGFDPEADRGRYHVTPGGVVVLPKGSPSFYARDSRDGGSGYQE
jgi:glucose-1-phosphate adenylyltransferase